MVEFPVVAIGPLAVQSDFMGSNHSRNGFYTMPSVHMNEKRGPLTVWLAHALPPRLVISPSPVVSSGAGHNIPRYLVGATNASRSCSPPDLLLNVELQWQARFKQMFLGNGIVSVNSKTSAEHSLFNGAILILPAWTPAGPNANRPPTLFKRWPTQGLQYI